ncbi:MAG: hypothetical protein M3081_15260 [Gemmatimonadota bacterium]|nr:hypothetical protein [Gemmatimonadota bacterium]
MRTHQWIDERSRTLAAAVAERVHRDPALMTDVRARLERRIAVGAPRGKATAREWLRLLDSLPLRALLEFLVEESEDATRLRQSSPFLSILSSAERDAIMQQFERL